MSKYLEEWGLEVIFPCMEVDAAVPPYRYVGCFTDRQDEWIFFWWRSGPKNADTCASDCEAHQFKFFGMGGGRGRECYCGNGGYERYGATGGCSTCDYYGSFTCGAKDSYWRLLAVYQLTSGMAATDDRFIGCWGVSSGSPLVVINGPQIVGTGANQTVSQCAIACKKTGAIYAAITVQNAGWTCACGSDLVWGSPRFPAATTDCSQLCDDGNFCGANQRAAVFRAVCLSKEYGDDCLPCHCMNDVTCDTTTGACPGFCAYGWRRQVSGGPCSVAHTPGIYMTRQYPCGRQPIWETQQNLTSVIDSSSDTCIDSSSISNDTWWMLRTIEQRMRIHGIVITFKDVLKCSGIGMPLVFFTSTPATFSSCDTDSNCLNRHLLYPRVMAATNRCIYDLITEPAIFSDSVEFEFQEGITICEISVL